MLETDLTIAAEIKLYYDLFIPDDVSRPAPLLIAVHGYGAHKRYMMREAQAVASDDFVIASVQAPHQHFRKTEDGYRAGFGWLTDFHPEESVGLHHNFLLEVIETLSRGEVIDRTRVVLFGFSQACALNFRFAFTFPDKLAAVIAICGGIPGDIDSNPKYAPSKAKSFYLYGDEDEFYSQEQFAEFDERLRALLPRYESKHYAAKHEITAEMREDVKRFLADLSLDERVAPRPTHARPQEE